MKWRLNKIQYPIYNLGPGKRIGIWVQGCSLGCNGCLNKTTWSKHGGKTLTVSDVFNWIAGRQANFDGITISGGEPFQQYECLIAFLHLVKTRTNYGTYCYSGYTLAELETLFPDRLYARYLDYLVDGRYVSGTPDNRNLKGSSNQTIYRFVDEVAIEQTAEPSNNRWSVHVTKNNRIYMAGIPRESDLEGICSELKEVGIEKRFI
jgi:anaerobic ribonucleoside-triphosphate reductase activating protein